MSTSVELAINDFRSYWRSPEAATAASVRLPELMAGLVLDGHHLKHWIDGGETTPDNMTLLCTYHHTMSHEGGFRIVKDADETLRFVTADGRTIPRAGYRLDDFVDDDVGSPAANPSAEGFGRTPVRRPSADAEVQESWPNEVRELRAIYRIGARRAVAS